jgi:signal transduction histidine kinase
VWANSVWLDWTGFAFAELVGQAAPYPFWISHQDLVLLYKEGAGLALGSGPDSSSSSRPLPFRRSDKSVFWCHLDTVIEELADRHFVVALLRRAHDPALPLPGAMTEETGLAFPVSLPADLPFAAACVDQTGRIVWANELFFQQIVPAPAALGARIHERFVGISAGALQRIADEVSAERVGKVGRLVVHALEGGTSRPLIAYWTTLVGLGGVDFLFAFGEDWSELGLFHNWPGANGTAIQRPGDDSLALLLTLGREVAFWDQRWSARTGLTNQEIAGAPTEVVLDWLFPRERDRNQVAHWMLQPDRRGRQFVLDLLIPGGSEPFVCSFLPVSQPGHQAWLLLADDPLSPAGEEGASLAPLRSFLRGLGNVLNHAVLGPHSLAEAALKRGKLSPEGTSALAQIVDRGQSVARLLAALQDLSAVEPPTTEPISLPALVREYLAVQCAGAEHDAFELDVDLPETGFAVRANRRMITTVVRHLFLNARQASVADRSCRIQVRVFALADAIGCSISDNGEGLPTEDWVQLLAPFVSTKGPFARDARHAAIDASGLGLTVCRHLLALHGGRLELRAQPGAGTTAIFYLPRACR